MALEWKIEDNSDIILHAKEEAIFAALDDVGLHLQGEAADELENEPRRVDTGTLKGSIDHQVDGHTLLVGTPVEYAPYVHEGTYRMTANPFIKNAFDRNIDQVERYIMEHLQNA